MIYDVLICNLFHLIDINFISLGGLDSMLGLSITEKYRALAADTHRRGFNCSQSVLFTLSDTVGLDKKTALLVSSSFGGGAKNSEICGAVSGALMAIGCKYGYIDPLYPNKEEFYDIVREFTRRFKEKHGTPYLPRLTRH